MIIIKIKNKLKAIYNFFHNAFKDIDQEYNLILEDMIFSPRHQQKVPLIRILGSGGYIIETCSNILKHDKYKCHLHPDDLLIINKLYHELYSEHDCIVQEDINGEIYFSDGNSINIYKPDLNQFELNKLFSLPKEQIVKVLEKRGFKQARDINTEIDLLQKRLKNSKDNKRFYNNIIPLNKSS